MVTLPEELSAGWVDTVLAGSSGIFTTGKQFDEYVVCYDQSKETGWYIISKIPLTNIVNESLSGLNLNLLITVVTAVFIAVLLAILLSRSISKPVNSLVKAISKSSAGEFRHMVVPQGTSETRMLADAYNTMNRSLKTLIDENYTIKLREKDAVIKSLHNQINPHFLYNSLNCINWLAIEENCDRTSDMIVNLSEILQYTIGVNNMVTFEDEYRWLCRYIDIMSIRFEGMFTFTQDISPEVFGVHTPKLILQPIVENIFIHGFKDLKSGGKIQFSASVTAEDELSVCVEDNGLGITGRRLREITSCSERNTDDHIGIQNTDKRIKLMYGDAYGISIESKEGVGTKVIILLKI